MSSYPGTSADTVTEDIEVEPVGEELERQVDDIQRELETRQEKKNKYKALYMKEKEKMENLVEQHGAEMKQKDEMIETLKKRIDELPNTWDMKVRALEVRTHIIRTLVNPFMPNVFSHQYQLD